MAPSLDNGAKLSFNAKNGAITINGASKVLLANVGASNGVVHLINAVLLPPSVQKHLQLAMLA